MVSTVIILPNTNNTGKMITGNGENRQAQQLAAANETHTGESKSTETRSQWHTPKAFATLVRLIKQRLVAIGHGQNTCSQKKKPRQTE